VSEDSNFFFDTKNQYLITVYYYNVITYNKYKIIDILHDFNILNLHNFGFLKMISELTLKYFILKEFMKT